MTDSDVSVVAESILALRRERRALFDDLDRFEAVLIMHMSERGVKSLPYRDVVFKAVRRKIIGTPSQRKYWRSLQPDVALDQWHQPFGLTIAYPERKVA